MADINEIIEIVSTVFKKRAERFARATTVSKVLLVIGSALATGLHFAVHDHWATLDYLGMGISLLVLLCGAFLLAVDHDPSTELEAARKAIEIAQQRQRDLESALDEFPEHETARARAVELYLAMSAMRRAVEYSLDVQNRTLPEMIVALLEAGKRSLKISCGFDLKQHFTICVYEARSAPATSRHKMFLHCIAHDRSVECSVENARVWPSGVGVAGYAHSSGEEVIVADLNTATLGAVSNYQPKPDDGTLYRSIAAVPIRVSGNPEPWGVVVGTSNVAAHFNTEPGLQTAEGLRALASMVGLAVQTHSVRQVVAMPVPRETAEPAPTDSAKT